MPIEGAAESYNTLGLAYLSTGSYDEAIENFEAALRLRPDFESARLNLKHAYRQRGRPLSRRLQGHNTFEPFPIKKGSKNCLTTKT
jgi:tetratricopeptide (TPR) repeat protein